MKALFRFTLHTICCFTQYSFSQQRTNQLAAEEYIRVHGYKLMYLISQKLNQNNFWLLLRSRLYLRRQAYTWGRQTIIVLGVKLYALYQNGIHKENCLHTIKITRLLFKWVFLNFECWFSRSLLHYHYSVAKNLYRYNVSPTLKLIESAMKRNVLQKINEWLVNIKII